MVQLYGSEKTCHPRKNPGKYFFETRGFFLTVRQCINAIRNFTGTILPNIVGTAVNDDVFEVAWNR